MSKIFFRYGVVERGCEQFGYSEKEVWIQAGREVGFNTLETVEEINERAEKENFEPVFHNPDTVKR
jgi:hypothetical protein